MIQVIHRALDIVEFIARDPDKEFGLGEIAESLELNKGTCANIIKTLVNRGYLDQSGKNLAPFGIGSTFFMLDCAPFAMSRHRYSLLGFK